MYAFRPCSLHAWILSLRLTSVVSAWQLSPVQYMQGEPSKQAWGLDGDRDEDAND